MSCQKTSCQKINRLFEEYLEEPDDGEQNYIHEVYSQVGLQNNQKKFVFDFMAQEFVNFNKSHLYVKLQVVNEMGQHSLTENNSQ